MLTGPTATNGQREESWESSGGTVLKPQQLSTYHYDKSDRRGGKQMVERVGQYERRPRPDGRLDLRARTSRDGRVL